MSVHYETDSVSFMYPALGGLIYRLSAVAKAPVQIDVLRTALEGLQPRFPIMCSHLERTFFGYRHIPATDFDVITAGEPFFQKPDLFDTQKPSFRMYVRGCRVTMDVYHGNGDGGAGMRFLAALMADYFLLLRGKPPVNAPLPDDEALCDPYKRYYTPAKPAKLLEKDSYDLRISYPKEYWISRFSCISVNLAELKAFAKPRGLTVNDVLAGTVALSIFRETDAKDGDLPVTVSAPIDLRKQYGSNSQRNFVFFSNVRTTKDCAVDLETISKQVHSLMQSATTPEAMRRGIALTYLGANNFIVKYSPRSLRERTVRKGYRHVSGHSITTTLSNVGYYTLPEEVADDLERLEMWLGNGRGSINTAAVGYGDRVSLCVTCGSEETVLEDQMQNILCENGIASTRDSFTYKNAELCDT